MKDIVIAESLLLIDTVAVVWSELLFPFCVTISVLDLLLLILGKQVLFSTSLKILTFILYTFKGALVN